MRKLAVSRAMGLAVFLSFAMPAAGRGNAISAASPGAFWLLASVLLLSRRVMSR